METERSGVRTDIARHKKYHVYVLCYDVSDINMTSNSATESYLANSRWRCSDTSFFYYNSNHQTAARSNHSIHSSHDHNSTTLDTGRYCRPSKRPRKEAMLGDVTDHQAAETNEQRCSERQSGQHEQLTTKRMKWGSCANCTVPLLLNSTLKCAYRQLYFFNHAKALRRDAVYSCSRTEGQKRNVYSKCKLM